jgi:hypothetical protein
MRCTYYGGSTAKFISGVLQHGIVPMEGVPHRFVVPGSERIFSLYAAGTEVVYAEFHRPYDFNWVKGFPATLLRENKGDEVGRPFVDLDFLVTCKLLDLPTYQAALSKHPTPLALAMAIQSASKSIKPDYPRTRKGGVRLTDLIEELVYFDLQEYRHTSEEVSFKTPTYSLESLFNTYYSASCIFTYNFKHCHSLELTKDAYIDGRNSGPLNLEYFEGLGLLDTARFKELLVVMTAPEAMQRAVRERLGYLVRDAETLELPSELLGND